MTPRTPREREHEARHANALDFAIGKLEADPDDTSACIAICWFVCRTPFDSVRERAIEAIRAAGEAFREAGASLPA